MKLQDSMSVSAMSVLLTLEAAPQHHQGECYMFCDVNKMKDCHVPLSLPSLLYPLDKITTR